MNNNFSSNLKKLRKNFGLSQEKLSHKINVTKSTISAYEKGTKAPNFYTLITLSKVFDCSLDELVFGNVKNNNLNSEEIKNIEYKFIQDIRKCFESYSIDLKVLLSQENNNLELSNEIDINTDNIINFDD